MWPVRMCKIRLVGLKSNLRSTIESVERYGGLEIKKFSSSHLSNIAYSSERQELLSQLLKLEGLIGLVEKADIKSKVDISYAKSFLKSRDLSSAEEKIRAATSEIQGLESELEILKNEKNRLRMFSKFGIDFGKLSTGSLQLIAGIIQNANLPYVEKSLKSAECSYAVKPASQTSSIVLIAIRKGSENVISSFSKYGFERISVPSITSTASAELQKAEGKTAEITKRKAELKKELSGISKKYYGALVASKEYLGIESSKIAAESLFGATGHTFILEAYLPEKNFSGFEKFAKENFGNEFFLKKLGSEELERQHEATPTLLENPKIFAPFEFMTRFMALPKSNEIDPTIVFLLFFPVFYGMMVGDVFYGLISFLLAALIVKKTSPNGILNPVAKIWMWGAIPTIIFGFVFDEFAGMPHEKILSFFGFENMVLYHGLERMHNIQILLSITILLGVFTIAVGFLMGFMNAARHHDMKHAIAKFAWFAFVCAGTVLISTFMFKALPEYLLIPSGVILGVSLLAIIFLEGFLGLLEVPSVIGNILSFARILAVGLVGVVIAMILNDLAFPSPDKGLLLIILVPLYIFGHIFNAFLAMFESLIQGARLNFVEFYSKFFHGGGKEFTPFRFSRKYIKN